MYKVSYEHKIHGSQVEYFDGPINNLVDYFDCLKREDFKINEWKIYRWDEKLEEWILKAVS